MLSFHKKYYEKHTLFVGFSVAVLLGEQGKTLTEVDFSILKASLLLVAESDVATDLQKETCFFIILSILLRIRKANTLYSEATFLQCLTLYRMFKTACPTLARHVLHKDKASEREYNNYFFNTAIKHGFDAKPKEGKISPSF